MGCKRLMIFCEMTGDCLPLTQDVELRSQICRSLTMMVIPGRKILYCDKLEKNVATSVAPRRRIVSPMFPVQVKQMAIHHCFHQVQMKLMT